MNRKGLSGMLGRTQLPDDWIELAGEHIAGMKLDSNSWIVGFDRYNRHYRYNRRYWYPTRGCIETRECFILRAKEYLLEENLLAWKDISTLVRVESIREVNAVKRIFTGDEDIEKARFYSSLVRDHWSIENSLHWYLDVIFREDACRVRSGHAPANLSVVRKGCPRFPPDGIKLL